MSSSREPHPGEPRPGGPLLGLVGPTAAGKTRMGIEVATDLRDRGYAVEILSCDSMGVYRGLDIAADKPSTEERRGIPHHLFDLVDPGEPFTAVAFREAARGTIAEVQRRGNAPLLVGGSGLYFRAVVDELEFAPTDPEVRGRLEREDPEELYERVREADPDAAKRIDRRNVRRIVRAAEILELSGRPPSELRRSWERFESPYHLAVVGLTWERGELLRRAEERVRRELDAGLLEEVRGVVAGGISPTARQALGVKEILEHLEGRLTFEEATGVLVRNTKRFVRRQLSWFRADPRVEWVDASELGWDGARSRIVERFGRVLEG